MKDKRATGISRSDKLLLRFPRSHSLTGWRKVLAGGWEIAGIVRAQCHLPLAVTQSIIFNAAFEFGIQKPNRIADPNLTNGKRTTGRYFDTAAFIKG
jgi:hypothetical protein